MMSNHFLGFFKLEVDNNKIEHDISISGFDDEISSRYDASFNNIFYNDEKKITDILPKDSDYIILMVNTENDLAKVDINNPTDSIKFYYYNFLTKKIYSITIDKIMDDGNILDAINSFIHENSEIMSLKLIDSLQKSVAASLIQTITDDAAKKEKPHDVDNKLIIEELQTQIHESLNDVITDKANAEKVIVLTQQIQQKLNDAIDEKSRIATEEAEKTRIATEEADKTRTAIEEAEKTRIAIEEAEKTRIIEELQKQIEQNLNVVITDKANADAKAKADKETADKAKADKEAADKAKADKEAADKAKAEAADKAKADAADKAIIAQLQEQIQNNLTNAIVEKNLADTVIVDEKPISENTSNEILNINPDANPIYLISKDIPTTGGNMISDPIERIVSIFKKDYILKINSLPLDKLKKLYPDYLNIIPLFFINYEIPSDLLNKKEIKDLLLNQNNEQIETHIINPSKTQKYESTYHILDIIKLYRYLNRFSIEGANIEIKNLENIINNYNYCYPKIENESTQNEIEINGMKRPELHFTDTINQIEKIEMTNINKMIKTLNSDKIITYLKITNFEHNDYKQYNQRFRVFVKNNNSLIVQYKNDNYVYYEKDEKGKYNIVKRGEKPQDTNTIYDSKNAQRGYYDLSGNVDRSAGNVVKTYDNSYLYGNYNFVFTPGYKNNEIASQMTDVIEKLNSGKPVLIIGYGASGAGKTSSLIYFKGKKDNTEIVDNGVLVHLCNKMANDNNVFIINVLVKEFFFSNNINDYIKVSSDDNSFVQTNADDKSNANRCILDEKTNLYTCNKTDFTFEYDNKQNTGFNMIDTDTAKYNNYINNYIHKYRQSTNNEPNYSLGSVIEILVDKDRYVKATTNNPQSSRSHVLVFINFIQKDNKINNIGSIIIGDFAGVENKFECNNPDVIDKFMNIKDNAGNIIYDTSYNESSIIVGGNKELVVEKIAQNFTNNIITKMNIIVKENRNYIKNIGDYIKEITKYEKNEITFDYTSFLKSNIDPPPEYTKEVIDDVLNLDKIIEIGTNKIFDNRKAIEKSKNKFNKSSYENLKKLFKNLTLIEEIRYYDGYENKIHNIGSLLVNDENIQSQFTSIQGYLNDFLFTQPQTIFDKIDKIKPLLKKIVDRFNTLKLDIKYFPAFVYIHKKLVDAKTFNMYVFWFKLYKIKNVVEESRGVINHANYIENIEFNNIIDFFSERLSMRVKQDIDTSNKTKSNKKLSDIELNDKYVTIYSQIYINEIVKLDDLIGKLIPNYKKSENICKNRLYEGSFINSSIADLRNTIKTMMIAKNDGNQYNYADIESYCLNQYCPGENCFKIEYKQNPNKAIESVLIQSIYDELTNHASMSINEFYKNLYICIFCVFNISRAVNNPPDIPYIEINDLKQNIALYKNKIDILGSDEFNKNQTFIELCNAIYENGKKLETLLNDETQFENKLQYLTIDSSDNLVYSKFINRINIIQRNDPNENMLVKYNELQDFINVIDNHNAVTPIGTLDFIDNVAKFTTTNSTCMIRNEFTDTEFKEIYTSESFMIEPSESLKPQKLQNTPAFNQREPIELTQQNKKKISDAKSTGVTQSKKPYPTNNNTTKKKPWSG